MKNETEHHNVIYNIATSLPVIGTPSRFLLEYTMMGINQYGYILGLVRGGLVGIVMFVLMLTLTEVIPLGWDIVHYYLQMTYVEPVKAEERGMLLGREPANEHPGWKHWHERFTFDLDWLNPGKYLLKEDPKPWNMEDQ